MTVYITLLLAGLGFLTIRITSIDAKVDQLKDMLLTGQIKVYSPLPSSPPVRIALERRSFFTRAIDKS